MSLFLFAMGMLGVPICLVLLVIKAIRRKPKKKTAIALAIFFVSFIVGLCIPSNSTDEPEEPKANVVEEVTPDPTEVPTPTPEPTATAEPTAEPTPVGGDIEQNELAELGTKENPIKVSIEQLVSEMYSNIDAAKAKYNEEWIEITGKVLDADNVAGMTRFYLYGEHGGSGLRICCWVNEDILKPFDYQGEVHTFLGQVREITTVNATEIGDCQIISD